MSIITFTDIKETFGNNEEIIFGNDWIKTNNNYKELLKNKKFSFIKFNYSPDKNFKNYIKEIRARILKELMPQLNKMHKKKYNERMWKVLLDRWLIEYLEANYYRWKMVENSLKKAKKFKFIFLKNLEKHITPFDSRDFHCLSLESDQYNQYIFQRILVFLKNENNSKIHFSFSKAKLIKEKLSNVNLKKMNFFRLIKKILNMFFFVFIKKNKIFFDMDSSGVKFFLLNLKLKQIPYFNQSYFFNNEYVKLLTQQSKINTKLRNKVKFKLLKKNKFEKYLNQNIIYDIPTAIIEDFTKLDNKVKKIPFSPQIIISDSTFTYNTFFKFWVVKCLENKAKFFTADHGGSFGSLFTTVNYNEEISNFSIRMHKSIFKNHIQLPLLKVLKYSNFRKNYKNLKNLSMVGFEIAKYPKHPFIAPLSNEGLYQIDFLKKFYNQLNLNLKKTFFFKPQTSNGFVKTLDTANRVKEIIPKSKVASNYIKIFKKSKIIIVNTPKTSLCEALISGPTVLLYKKKYWRHTSHFNNLVSNLKNAKILFEDPIEAANHINKVWNNVDEWWESKKVKKVRKQFNSEAFDISSNSVEKWKNFLNLQLKNN